MMPDDIAAAWYRNDRMTLDLTTDEVKLLTHSCAVAEQTLKQGGWMDEAKQAKKLSAKLNEQLYAYIRATENEQQRTNSPHGN